MDQTDSRTKSDTFDFDTEGDSPVRTYRPLNSNTSKIVTNDDASESARRAEIDKDRSLKEICSFNNNNVEKEIKVETDKQTATNGTLSAATKTAQDFKGRETTPDRPGVSYIVSEELLKRCNRMVKVPLRASMVHALIESYGLLNHMKVVAPAAASEEELCVVHSKDYLHFLQHVSRHDDEEKYEEEAQQYGLSYDCPVQPDVYEYAALVAGATLKAAQCLTSGECQVAINWFGGWHHAKKDSASGFCYTNDIALGILKLREKFDRVLYVDLDLHHGDGVEDAFCATDKVLTISVHKLMAGFFPGTGRLEDIGIGKGKFYSVNIPLLDGIKDPEFVALVSRVLKKAKEQFCPSAVVCQCGADGIAGDPMESFNLTPTSLIFLVNLLRSWKLPLLLLGGGGYNHANTARTWACLTGLAVGRIKLPTDIPEHKFLMQYGPGYELSISPGNKKDENSREHLQTVYRQVMENLSHIS